MIVAPKPRASYFVPKLTMKTPKTPANLLPMSALLSLLVISSCSKIPITPPIVPNPIILQSLEKFPFQRYLDSSLALSSQGIDLSLIPGTLIDPSTHTETPGQAELALAFRTNTPAIVTSLALLLPAGGYSHTVTLWDSATGTVLAQTAVPSKDSGKWSSISLALINQQVVIQPDKGYILGYNSLAIGNSIGTYSPGNSVYNLYGIFDFSKNDGGTFRPILPFTEGAITFEAGWMINYNTPVGPSIFPGSIAPNESVNSLFGLPDLGYISQ